MAEELLEDFMEICAVLHAKSLAAGALHYQLLLPDLRSTIVSREKCEDPSLIDAQPKPVLREQEACRRSPTC